MSLNVSGFLNSRIEEITQNLLKTNSEYALAVEKSNDLYNNIEPIINREKEITISGGDCMDFKDLFEIESVASSIIQQELYRQGYFDCVRLLKMIDALSY